jgi:DNA-binding transcriptional ArsR family regulator
VSSPPALASANSLLAGLVRRSQRDVFEGFLHELGAELEMSPTRVSRALRTLRDAGRVDIERRGHGTRPTRARIRSRSPLPDSASRGPAVAFADRLLEHLHTLSDGGIVERPLVEVARELDVGAPSVSRALGRLVEEGHARVDQVGTRARPTRIALTGADRGSEGGALRAENARLRAENARLRAENARLRADPGGPDRSARRIAVGG